MVNLPMCVCTQCIEGVVQGFLRDAGYLLAVNIEGTWFVKKLNCDIGARIRCSSASLEECFGEFVNILNSSVPPVKVLAPFFFLMPFYPPPCYIDGQGFYAIPNFL